MTAHARDIGYLVNPPLHRHHDVDTLVVDLVDALRGEPVVGMAIDGTCATLVEVTVRVTFPDQALLEHVKPRLVDEVRRGMGKRVLGAWSIAAQAFLLDVTTTPGDVHQPPGFTDVPGNQDGGTVTRAGTITLPVTDERSVDLLGTAVSTFLAQPAFQLAAAIGAEACVSGVIGGASFSGQAFDGEAPVVAVRYWLQLGNAPHARAWFHAPGVADAIAWWCDGFLVTADQAQDGKEVMKRRNVDGVPVSIGGPDDVLDLVDELDFLAFYPAIQRVDGSIGRIVIDLDVQPGLRATIGDDGAWRMACAVSDAIVATFSEVGFPAPARHFSGSRGIHACWTLAPGAILVGDDGQVDDPWYRLAVRAGDPRAGQLRASEQLLRDPGAAIKLLARAGCIRAIHEHASTYRREMTGALFDAFRAAGAIVPVTLSREDTASRFKVVLDVQPTVHRVLSPHHKSGLICRAITGRDGEIVPAFRDLDAVIEAARVDAATAAFPGCPSAFHQPPGVVSREVLHAASRALAPEIGMILGLGPAGASEMWPESYRAWTDHYRQLAMAILEGEP